MGFSTDIKDVGFLNQWNTEMSTFADGIFDNSTKTVENDGALAAVDGVERGVEKGGGRADNSGGACYTV